MTSFVVELCGLPGSGKTTLARHTREALLARGVGCAVADAPISANTTRAARVARRAVAVARESARHPVRTADAARVIATSGQPSSRDTVAGLAQWLAVVDLIPHSRRVPGVHLLEEGIIQTTWTLALRAGRDPTPGIWRGLRSMSRSDLVLMVDAPVQLAEARLGLRASRHSRTQHLPPELRRAELERGRVLLERLLEGSPIRVLRMTLDELASPSERGERAADMVLRTVGHQPLS